VSTILIRLGGRWRIPERRLPIMVGFAASGVVAGACVVTAVFVSVALLTGGYPQPRELAGPALMGTLVFAAWSAAALMVAQLRRAHEAERRALAAQSVAAQARLRMLRHQLNPHFLFNALNSLSVTIDEDRDRAQRLLLDLSSLLRDALADDSEKGTLGDELDRVERYLRIERARFEGKLHVETSVPLDLLGTPCLPLLLQPLVENAIKHGCAGSEVEVKLVASRDGENIRVLVSNPICTGSTRGTGVGLANVRERLAVRYGSAHRFEQRQLMDGRMESELSWPCEPIP
jgi:LytS/YehU family sensor histidine kinase